MLSVAQSCICHLTLSEDKLAQIMTAGLDNAKLNSVSF